MTTTSLGTRTCIGGLSVLAEDVVRRFGDRVVLDHLRLEIAASEFVVLLGPSGSGKTTLLRLLGGLDQPDFGAVSVPRARAIVFQGARLLPWRWAWQNVTTGLYGRDAATAGLPVRPDPALILLDEPFATLDARATLQMRDLVRSLHGRHHATILLATQDVDEAIALADRILIIRDGRIGAQHLVELRGRDRCGGLAREELRADLLGEISVLFTHSGVSVVRKRP